jgi:hypothetical protein
LKYGQTSLSCGAFADFGESSTCIDKAVLKASWKAKGGICAVVLPSDTDEHNWSVSKILEYPTALDVYNFHPGYLHHKRLFPIHPTYFILPSVYRPG